MSVLIKMIASNPPSLMIVAGFLLLLMGLTTNNREAISFGNWVMLGGFILQVLWLVFRRR